MFVLLTLIIILSVFYIYNQQNFSFKYKLILGFIIMSAITFKFGFAFFLLLLLLIFLIVGILSDKQRFNEFDFKTFFNENYQRNFFNHYSNFKNSNTSSNNKLSMSEEEAYKILGLEVGANESEIKAAYLKLISQFHPDKTGGSDYFASKINQARDILLK